MPVPEGCRAITWLGQLHQCCGSMGTPWLTRLHLLGMYMDFSGNFQGFFDVCFLPVTSEKALLYLDL